MKTYATVFFGAALVAIFAMPVLTRLARRLRLLDRPGARKVHKTPIPRIGGVVVVLATLALTIPVFLLENTVGESFRQSQPRILMVLFCSVFMFGIGLIDDIRGLRARVKLIAQVSAATALCAVGVRIDTIGLGDYLTLDLGVLAWPVTLLWIVGITNAVNLIDGLDGLAAGIAAITCGVIAFFSIYTGQPVISVLMLGLLGSLVGFLFFNSNPAKVFMGDSGTLFIGFLLAASSVMCAVKTATIVGVVIPGLALGVPIFDTLFSILRRVLERRSVFAPDSKHIHHRLLSMGLGQRRAVLIMYLITLLAAGLGISMLFLHHTGNAIVFVGTTLMLILAFRAVGAVRLRESLAILRNNLTVARNTGEERRLFELTQLRTREAKSFDEWWRAVCAMAEQLDFARLAVSTTDSNGTNWSYVWQCRGDQPPRQELIRLTMPLHHGTAGPRLELEVALKVNGSLESSARRAEWLGRLVDECSPNVLSTSDRAAPAVPLTLRQPG